MFICARHGLVESRTYSISIFCSLASDKCPYSIAPNECTSGIGNFNHVSKTMKNHCIWWAHWTQNKQTHLWSRIEDADGVWLQLAIQNRSAGRQLIAKKHDSLTWFALAWGVIFCFPSWHSLIYFIFFILACFIQSRNIQCQPYRPEDNQPFAKCFVTLELLWSALTRPYATKKYQEWA